MYEELKIITFPDPRLKKVSAPVTVFDDNLRALADRMFVLMREAHGVGLAAPQVGLNIQLFVMNATGLPEDDRVYINPLLTEAEDEEEGEEGCLSLPDIRVNVWRSKTLRMQAKDLHGNPVDLKETGYVARVWQHETDHLMGILLTDRMGPVAKMANRKTLRDMEAAWEEKHGKKAKK